MNTGGLVVKKQEMTKMRVNDAFVPVTLVKILPQEIIRYKNQEKDGYVSAVVGVEKKELSKAKGKKVDYTMVAEFPVDDSFIQNNNVGKILDVSFVDGVQEVSITGYAKGKGFQGMIKRCGVHGMPATHGHKFTRTGGSKGNRKPRRTMKGHPHAGHMGTQKITLKGIKILDTMKNDKEQILVLQGSLPGSYNGLLKMFLA